MLVFTEVVFYFSIYFFLIKDSLSEDIKVSITLMVSHLCCGKYNVIRDNMLANIMLNVVELYVLREY